MSASSKIDKKIADLWDWRGERLAEIRKLIHEAAPEVVEEWKWMGSPVWSHNGILAVASAPRNKVRLTFVYGAKLPDPKKLFSATLDGNKRAIELYQGDKVDGAAFKALVREAAATTPKTLTESRYSFQAATHRFRRPTATPPYRPTSRPCRAGRATWDAAWTTSLCAPCPVCARP